MKTLIRNLACLALASTLLSLTGCVTCPCGSKCCDSDADPAQPEAAQPEAATPDADPK